MALRAFQCNPSLGGFGNESQGNAQVLIDYQRKSKSDNSTIVKSSKNNYDKSCDLEKAGKFSADDTSTIGTEGDEDCCDAFAQIVKELVDNAVDACGKNNTTSSTKIDVNVDESVLKRVRVSIDAVTHEKYSTLLKKGDAKSGKKVKDQVLRITVSDNGCGMANIKKCVSAFSTSKAGSGKGDKLNRQGNNPRLKINTSNEENDDYHIKEMKEKQWESEQTLTAGRYGIGLTLCLLHAQRLVPNSCASITSATASASVWTRASFVVDTNRDAVLCVKQETLAKKKKGEKESGTAVSLLVPGGKAAKRAWPRLAEYFARFQLSLGLGCSLQVMAPSLSPVPLFIRPHFEAENLRVAREKKRLEKEATKREIQNEKEPISSQTVSQTPQSDDEESYWNDEIFNDDFDANGNNCFVEEEISQENHTKVGNGIPQKESQDVEGVNTPNEVDMKRKEEGEQHRQMIQRAASAYLNKPLKLKNIAHCIQPIRRRILSKEKSFSSPRNGPMLEVDMIVHGPDEEKEEDQDEYDNSGIGDHKPDPFETNFEETCALNSSNSSDNKSARMMLIRMVNRVPLLDGAEGSACGLVRGISKKHSMWNSFGLEISYMDTVSTITGRESNKENEYPSDSSIAELHIPSFALRDNGQVAPFFNQNNNHSLFVEQQDIEGEDGYDSVQDDDDTVTGENKRKRTSKAILLPAGLRLGNILLILQLHAKPSELPLPTLSKGRLPMNDAAIDEALEVGLATCLRSLQKTNPSLLLTSNQLKRTERNVRYVPAAASAIASILSNIQNTELRNNLIEKVQGWSKDTSNDSTVKERQSRLSDDNQYSSLHGSASVTANESHSGERSKVLLKEQKILSQTIEERFRMVMNLREQERKRRERTKNMTGKKVKEMKLTESNDQKEETNEGRAERSHSDESSDTSSADDLHDFLPDDDDVGDNDDDDVDEKVNVNVNDNIVETKGSFESIEWNKNNDANDNDERVDRATPAKTVVSSSDNSGFDSEFEVFDDVDFTNCTDSPNSKKSSLPSKKDRPQCQASRLSLGGKSGEVEVDADDDDFDEDDEWW